MNEEEMIEGRQTSLFELNSIEAVATVKAAGATVTGNVLRRHIREDPEKALLAQHRLWLNSIQHEYPMPHIPYKIGVYIPSLPPDALWRKKCSL